MLNPIRLQARQDDQVKFKLMDDKDGRDGEERFAGISESIQNLRQLAKKLAASQTDLLINGETGVGKDQYARYVHEMSGVRGAFVALNCAAIPETLFESELFGTEIGAYTGAVKARDGKIQQANGGTLFLDEIESMPLPQQAKLLRVLQDHKYERLGSTRSHSSHFRVIAATKRPLAEMAEAGEFREDLYYRINVVEITVPPLRERLSDAPLLMRKFVEEMVADADERADLLENLYQPEILSALLQHQWPGNVRELRSCAKRFSIGLPMFSQLRPKAAKFSLTQAREDFERLVIEAALRRASWSVQRASNDLSIPEQTLYYRMKRLNVESPRSMAGSNR